jgi:hypothetical protein
MILLIEFDNIHIVHAYQVVILLHNIYMGFALFQSTNDDQFTYGQILKYF